MKFVNFENDKVFEQLTTEQALGLLKLERGKEKLFTDCDELSVVMLCYDDGKRSYTSFGRCHRTTTSTYENLKYNLIAVVGKCKAHPKAEQKTTQIAIFDKHMNPIIEYNYNSSTTVKKALEQILKGSIATERRLSYTESDPEIAEKEAIKQSLSKIMMKIESNLQNEELNSNILYLLCFEKLGEILQSENSVNA